MNIDNFFRHLIGLPELSSSKIASLAGLSRQEYFRWRSVPLTRHTLTSWLHVARHLGFDFPSLLQVLAEWFKMHPEEIPAPRGRPRKSAAGAKKVVKV